MPDFLYPGVYVQEVDTGNQPIEGVSTSIAGFLGVAERGPLLPTLVTSFGDFVRTFGSYVNQGGVDRYLAYAVEGFFTNGGNEAFIARVTGAASVEATGAAGGLTLVANGPGAWGDRIYYKVADAGNGTASQFKLYVFYYQTPPPLPLVDPTLRDAASLRDPNRREPTILEVYDNLTDNPLATNFYVPVIQNSSTLVTATQAMAGRPANAGPTALAGGTDAAPTLADFEGNPAALPGQRTGLAGLHDVDEISLLSCPDENMVPTIADDLVAQCELRMDRFAILNSAFAAGQPSTLFPSVISKYAAFYYPWLNVVNPLTGLIVPVPPGGHVTGIYARSDSEVGVHKDPANEVISGIDSLQFLINNDQQAMLNPRGVNVLRYFRGAGNLVWGGRTTTNIPEWKYINVRRLFIFVEKSIQQGTQWAVFENNDPTLWARVRQSVGDFLTRLWLDGMLIGDTKDQAFFVRCDRTTMTQADLDNGRLICVIGIAPVKPAEFVIFQIGQWDGGASVSEQG